MSSAIIEIIKLLNYKYTCPYGIKKGDRAKKGSQFKGRLQESDFLVNNRRSNNDR